MPRGGVLRLAAARDTVMPGQPPVPGLDLAPGRYLRLVVGDSGAGMDARPWRRATEPFFTTKEVGKGTGLGLSMAHGFAVQSGGALTIDSAPGQGTVVTLWLPESSIAAAPDRPDIRTATARLGAGRVLLVENDQPVRGVMAAALREEGLTVTEAADGASALALLASAGDFEVVLTGHAMPGMTGGALATALARLRPGLPVVILTGNADRPPPDAPPDVPVLRKPIEPAELAARLRVLA